MKNKILISTLILLLCIVFLCSYSFATTNMMQSAGNTIMNAGNTIGNAAKNAGNSLVNGARSLTNGAATLGNDMMGGIDGMTDDAATTYDTTTMAANDDYTAQRTATANTGLFGMSDTMSTWLIMGVVGAIIVGLIWYYSAQYEHKDYNND